MVGVWVEKTTGDRHRAPFLGGYGDEHSNAIKRPELVESVLSLNPPSWLLMRVKVGGKGAWHKQRQRLGIEWLSVKAGRGTLREYYLIHCPQGSLLSEVKPYSDIAPRVLKGASLERKLNSLLSYRRHPRQKGLCRWQATKSLDKKLRVAWVRLEWEGLKLEWPDKGAKKERATRLAREIKSDPVFGLGKLDPAKVFILLRDAGMSRGDIVETVMEFKELKRRHWDLVSTKGKLKEGARNDRREGFKVNEGPDSVYSKSEAQSPQTSWDTVPAV